MTIVCIPLVVGQTLFRLWTYGDVLCKLTGFMQGARLLSNVNTAVKQRRQQKSFLHSIWKKRIPHVSVVNCNYCPIPLYFCTEIFRSDEAIFLDTREGYQKKVFCTIFSIPKLCIIIVLALIFRPHCSTTYVDAAYRCWCSMVCLSVCHDRKPYKKPLNRSRCRLGCGVGWTPWTMC